MLSFEFAGVLQKRSPQNAIPNGDYEWPVRVIYVLGMNNELCIAHIQLCVVMVHKAYLAFCFMLMFVGGGGGGSILYFPTV